MPLHLADADVLIDAMGGEGLAKKTISLFRRMASPKVAALLAPASHDRSTL